MSWKKGQSGNPGGRKRASVEFRKVVQAAKEGSMAAMAFLNGVVRDESATISQRQRAADSVLEWAFKGEMTPEETDAVQESATRTPRQRIELYKRAIEAEEQAIAEARETLQ